MEVRFRGRALQRRYERSAEAARAWGPEVGRRYVERVRILIGTERVADLYTFRALDLHPLTGERAGLHALRLTGQVRLVIRVDDERTVTVWEVVDYHG